MCDVVCLSPFTKYRSIMNCVPIQNTLTCQFCGFTWKLNDKFPQRNCPKHPEILKAAQQSAEKLGEPSLLEKGAHYAQALAHWFAAGCPKRTKEKAETCESVCKSCPGKHYDAEAWSGTGGCKICGCATSAQRWPIRSKTRMATEDCLKGFWPKE